MKIKINKLGQFVYISILCLFTITVYAQDESKYIRECKIEQQNGKYGVTFQGQQLIPFEYDSVTLWNEQNFKVQQNNLYGIYSIGIVDKKDESHISKQETIARIDIPEKNRYIYSINSIECSYDTIDEFDNNHFMLKKAHKIGLINQYCTTIIPCRFDEIKTVGNDYYVKMGGKQGIINIYGTTMLPCRFDEIKTIDNNYYVKMGEKQGVINIYGTTILPCRFDEIKTVDNNYYVKENGKMGIINIYGTTLIPCQYNEIKNINNIYCVKKEYNYGVINKYGTTILPCKYDKIEFLPNGQYLVYGDGKKQRYNAYGSFISNDSDNNVIYSTASEKE